MKLGIIGLKPRQIAHLKTRKTHGYEIHFYSDSSFKAERVAAFVRKMDRVLVIGPAVPASLFNHIPYLKRHSIAGGVSTVLHWIEQNPAPLEEVPAKESSDVSLTTALEASASEESRTDVSDQPDADSVEEGSKTTLEEPPEKLGESIPEGYLSHYVWQPDLAIIPTGTRGRHRYEILDAAEPGDVIRFARPSDIPLATWRQRITILRWQRAHKKDQAIEAHFYPTYVDLRIMKVEEKIVKKVADAVTVKTALPSAPAPAPNPEPTPCRPEERMFWVQVFLQHNTAPDPENSRLAAEAADRALNEFHNRFFKD